MRSAHSLDVEEPLQLHIGSHWSTTRDEPRSGTRRYHAFQHVNLSSANRVAKRAWIWVAILTVAVCLYPVEYQLTRVAVPAGVAVTWAGALLLWWPRRGVRAGLLLIGAFLAIAVCLPARPVDADRLAADYSRGLRIFRGVRYVWGGEGFLGIDCSGLVRKGFVWGQLYHGLRTVNGRPIRDAITLWWHDCSAIALRDGYRDWTLELFRDDTILSADLARLKPGDLAVTTDGVHVMAYLGSQTWIEADPNARKVIEVALPTDNPWFRTPVVFVRWRWLRTPEPPGINQAQAENAETNDRPTRFVCQGPAAGASLAAIGKVKH